MPQYRPNRALRADHTMIARPQTFAFFDLTRSRGLAARKSVYAARRSRMPRARCSGYVR